MTKTELFTKACNVYTRNKYTDSEHRLSRCNAWYYVDEDFEAVTLISYNALAAVYWHGTVWEFTHWSKTTTQHVQKFACFMDAPVISLYHCKGMSLNDYYAHESCDWYDVIFAVLNT